MGIPVVSLLSVATNLFIYELYANYMAFFFYKIRLAYGALNCAVSILLPRTIPNPKKSGNNTLLFN
jgi:hypothetical protein